MKFHLDITQDRKLLLLVPKNRNRAGTRFFSVMQFPLKQHFYHDGTRYLGQVGCEVSKSGYRLFFLKSIVQFFTQIYMNCFVSS